MSLKSIPVIDISPFKNGDHNVRKTVADRVAQASTDIGFLVISGHGIPSSVIKNMASTTKAFFALDVEEKNKSARPRPEIIRGYGGMESEGLGYSQEDETPPDLKEVFDVGPIDVPNTDYYRGTATGGRGCDDRLPFP